MKPLTAEQPEARTAEKGQRRPHMRGHQGGVLQKLLGALLLFTVPAFPWGCEGHQAAALIALKQLGPNAAAMVDQLLAGQPVDPKLHRFCAPTSLPVFADIATWADDIRTQRPATAPFHFIDITLDATPGSVNTFCAGNCVTSAITQAMDTLRAPDSDPKAKTEGLMFLIHFAGDMHQPMHAVTNNDRGGNCVPVAFFGTRTKPSGSPGSESFKPELHGIWDVELVRKIVGKQTVEQFADQLSSQFASQIEQWKQQPVDLEAWAWETHQFATTTAYGKLSAQVPVEAPVPVKTCSDDNHVSTRMKKLNEKINAAYLADATPVIEEQLAKAGTRLAVLLNQLWP